MSEGKPTRREMLDTIDAYVRLGIGRAEDAAAALTSLRFAFEGWEDAKDASAATLKAMALTICDRDAEIERLNKLRARILDALVGMIFQYLPDNTGDGRYSHTFMSAGEDTLGLMWELGLMREVAPEVFVFDDAALKEALKAVTGGQA